MLLCVPALLLEHLFNAVFPQSHCCWSEWMWLDHKWCVHEWWPASRCEGCGLALWRKLVKDPGGIIENLYCTLLSFRALGLFSTSGRKYLNFSDSCWSQDCCCFTHQFYKQNFEIARIGRVHHYFIGVFLQCLCKFERKLSFYLCLTLYVTSLFTAIYWKSGRTCSCQLFMQ